MKEMTSVASAMMTAEEKEELEREINKQTPTVTLAGEHPPTPGVTAKLNTTPRQSTDGHGHGHATPTPAPAPAPAPALPTETDPAPGPNGASTTPTPASRPVSAAFTTSETPAQSPSGTSTPKPATEGRKGKSKLTTEQKQKIDEIATERDEAMVKRVAELTEKLKERLRPFAEAQEPGGKNDPETQAFEARMTREADDLKLESFGVEVRVLPLRLRSLLLTTVFTATTHDRCASIEDVLSWS
jgi:X-domain of DnaJ-containing